MAGVESVSGTVVLSDTASGGSVTLTNVVFTLLGNLEGNPTGAANFGISVIQSFAATGPTTLNALETASGSATFTGLTGPINPGGAVVSAQDSYTALLYPNNSPSSSYGNGTVDTSATAYPGDMFPETLNFSSLPTGVFTGLTKTMNNPVGLKFSYTTSISPFNAIAGSGTSTTLTSGGFSFTNASVPEPSSVVLLGLGVAGILAVSRRFRSR